MERFSRGAWSARGARRRVSGQLLCEFNGGQHAAPPVDLGTRGVTEAQRHSRVRVGRVEHELDRVLRRVDQREGELVLVERGERLAALERDHQGLERGGSAVGELESKQVGAHECGLPGELIGPSYRQGGTRASIENARGGVVRAGRDAVRDGGRGAIGSNLWFSAREADAAARIASGRGGRGDPHLRAQRVLVLACAAACDDPHLRAWRPSSSPLEGGGRVASLLPLHV